LVSAVTVLHVSLSRPRYNYLIPSLLVLEVRSVTIYSMTGTVPQPTGSMNSVLETKSNTTTSTSGTRFDTDAGTLYVSKPFRSGTSKKLKAMIAFAPRKSHFDLENEQSGKNDFRGFFTLFWISMFLFAVSSYIRSIEATGYPLPFAFASLFSQDAIALAITDAVMVLSTGLCVPFAKAISKGWIKYYSFGLVLQHLWQMALLALAVTWTFNRHWPWVQSGFLTLHSLTMIMKVHSYVSTNGYLSWVNQQSEQTLAEIHRLATSADGSYDAAILVAQENRLKLEGPAPGSLTPDFASSLGTPQMTTPSAPDGTTVSYMDAKDAATLRRRLQKNPRDESSMNGVVNGLPATTGTQLLSPTDVQPPAPHPLVDHPNERISTLAKEYSEMETELTSTGPNYIRWPANITLKNFAVYQLIPTLVYELEYPRTDKIRPLYVFEKTVATFGTFALLYTVTESFIIPLTPTADQSFFRSLLDLSLPFMIAYLLLFYIIFECICNGFAELSYFADRQFYDDWWNSTSWDEFSRKWNKPVHTFLLRHVYASTMSSYKLSRQSAMFLTFLLSAAVHELVMAVVTKKIRMYLFMLQIAQIPLIAIGRIPMIKKNRLMGNIVFWIGLYAGFPLLCVAYCAY